MLDRYLLGLRQKEYREREAQKLKTELVRNNNKYMNQEPVSAEMLALWDSQPAITFNLDNRKKVN